MSVLGTVTLLLPEGNYEKGHEIILGEGDFKDQIKAEPHRNVYACVHTHP